MLKDDVSLKTKQNLLLFLFKLSDLYLCEGFQTLIRFYLSLKWIREKDLLFLRLSCE